NRDGIVAHQVHPVLPQVFNNFPNIWNYKRDVRNPLALKYPGGNRTWLENGFLGLNQLDSFAVRGLQTDASKAIRPSSELRAHFRTRLGISGELEPQHFGIEIEHALKVGAYDAGFKGCDHPQGPRLTCRT